MLRDEKSTSFIGQYAAIDQTTPYVKYEETDTSNYLDSGLWADNQYLD